MKHWIAPALLVAVCPGCILIESAEQVVFGDPKVEAAKHWKSMHEKVAKDEILVTSVSTDYPQNGFIRRADLNNGAITTFYEFSDRPSQKENGKLTAARIAELRKLTKGLPESTNEKTTTELLVTFWDGPARKTMRYDSSDLSPPVQRLCDAMKAESGLSDEELHEATGP